VLSILGAMDDDSRARILAAISKTNNEVAVALSARLAQ